MGNPRMTGSQSPGFTSDSIPRCSSVAIVGESVSGFCPSTRTCWPSRVAPSSGSSDHVGRPDGHPAPSHFLGGAERLLGSLHHAVGVEPCDEPGDAEETCRSDLGTGVGAGGASPSGWPGGARTRPGPCGDRCGACRAGSPCPRKGGEGRVIHQEGRASRVIPPSQRTSAMRVLRQVVRLHRMAVDEAAMPRLEPSPMSVCGLVELGQGVQDFRLDPLGREPRAAVVRRCRAIIDFPALGVHGRAAPASDDPWAVRY